MSVADELLTLSYHDMLTSRLKLHNYYILAFGNFTPSQVDSILQSSPHLLACKRRACGLYCCCALSIPWQWVSIRVWYLFIPWQFSVAVTLGLNQCSCSTLSPVSSGMGDCLLAGKLSHYVTSHLGQLSLAIPPRVGAITTGDVYGHHYGRKRRVLRSSSPCDQDCWHTDPVG